MHCTSWGGAISPSKSMHFHTFAPHPSPYRLFIVALCMVRLWLIVDCKPALRLVAAMSATIPQKQLMLGSGGFIQFPLTRLQTTHRPLRAIYCWVFHGSIVDDCYWEALRLVAAEFVPYFFQKQWSWAWDCPFHTNQDTEINPKLMHVLLVAVAVDSGKLQLGRLHDEAFSL